MLTTSIARYIYTYVVNDDMGTLLQKKYKRLDYNKISTMMSLQLPEANLHCPMLPTNSINTVAELQEMMVFLMLKMEKLT